VSEDNPIIIKNIYYMLTYAFRILKQSNYDDIETETFEHIYDMFAAILSKGVSKQVKQGLYKEYQERQDNISVIKGKLNINGTIKNRIQRNKRVVCDYDELTINNIYNQILKLTMVLLIKQAKLKRKYKILLKKNLLFFDQVDDIEVSSFKWSRLQFKRNNANYKMLLNICYFVIDGLLLTTEKGNKKITSYFDDQKMYRLFENFVLEYYKYHHKELRPSSTKIDWVIDDINSSVQFLPKMKTDIVLSKNDNKLIIDTKYYKSSTQSSQFSDKEKIHSNNLYQIYAYVKNEDKLNKGNISGLLLYAKTEENIAIDQSYSLSGNRISVKNLDLNIAFNEIRNQLEKITEMF
jgi:5-methylcytosine-specific restriction enzyme subunit McrC